MPDAVIHLAGIISIMPGKKKLLRSVNIDGTKAVLQACKQAKVKKLIYINTVHDKFATLLGIEGLPGIGANLDYIYLLERMGIRHIGLNME